VNPQIAAAVDLTLQGELINAAIDPELHPDLRSANAWILDLGGQSPCFCRFSLHVPGFIRFLELWIWLNWIDRLFWDMRERKQDLNLSELWQLEMISVRIKDDLMWLIGRTIRNDYLRWLPSRILTYPPDKAYLKMIFLFPGWDMLIPWRVDLLKCHFCPRQEIYEAGAGYLEYQYRFQAAVVPGRNFWRMSFEPDEFLCKVG